MAKKRKTKQEKVIADLRRQLVQPTASSSPEALRPSYTLSSTAFSHKHSSPVNQKLHNKPVTNYSYVASDLRKTALLTFLALAVQFVLYFVMTRS